MYNSRRPRRPTHVPLPLAVSWSLTRAVRIQEGPGAGVVVPSWWHGQSVAVPLRRSGNADTQAQETSRARLEGETSGLYWRRPRTPRRWHECPSLQPSRLTRTRSAPLAPVCHVRACHASPKRSLCIIRRETSAIYETTLASGPSVSSALGRPPSRGTWHRRWAARPTRDTPL